MPHPTTCQFVPTLVPAALVACEGPMLESPRYFVDGRSLYKCQRHAEWSMRANPAGPRFRPIKNGGKAKWTGKALVVAALLAFAVPAVAADDGAVAACLRTPRPAGTSAADHAAACTGGVGQPRGTEAPRATSPHASRGWSRDPSVPPTVAGPAPAPSYTAPTYTAPPAAPSELAECVRPQDTECRATEASILYQIQKSRRLNREGGR